MTTHGGCLGLSVVADCWLPVGFGGEGFGSAL
jgi:hypothetical protein